ncbi:hypothetical protein BKA64DRAFT_445449 [Cadophora sp. MPI-SDFR-AT-0126]|nr:hypothetical protein BKA64DRAFT_445449 [Leotiomycetes sp. MPI-SDFR-AT-0126]
MFLMSLIVSAISNRLKDRQNGVITILLSALLAGSDLVHTPGKGHSSHCYISFFEFLPRNCKPAGEATNQKPRACSRSGGQETYQELGLRETDRAKSAERMVLARLCQTSDLHRPIENMKPESAYVSPSRSDTSRPAIQVVLVYRFCNRNFGRPHMTVSNLFIYFRCFENWMNLRCDRCLRARA